MKKRYAKVVWSPEDVKEHRPEWTLKQCAEWLSENEKSVSDAMTRAGWDAIETLLPSEEESEEDNGGEE
jgi:hypothetical protein